MKFQINNNWKYWKDNDSFALIWNVPDSAQTVNVPHDPIQKELPSENSINKTATGHVDGGAYYYVKHLAIDDLSKRYRLRFEGVQKNVSVFVNGQFVGENKHGYSAFEVEITECLKAETDNEIRLIVKNNDESSRWYTGGGIYRDVYLITTDHMYAEDVKLTTKEITSNSADINVVAQLVNNYPQKQHAKLTVEFDQYQFTFNTIIPANSTLKFEKDITIVNPKLWSAEQPKLYSINVTLKSKQYEYNDQFMFGIRTISYNNINGLKINGIPQKLKGACIHHDSGILGAKTYFDYEYFKIKKLKDAGFNAIRMAHNPMSTAMLEACDLLGMYVMDETFDMWHRPKSDYDYSLNFEQNALIETKLMINNDYNHPSVIMYSLGNEIPDIGMDKGISTLAKLNNFVKEHDRSRPTLLSINGVFAAGDHVQTIVDDILKENNDFHGHVNNFLQVMDAYIDQIVNHPIITEILENVSAHVDILGYNYMHGRYNADSTINRVIVGSETYPPKISRNWKTILETNNVIGDFTWTGWDYIGEAGVGIPAYKFGEGGFGANFPARLAYCGDFDLIGTRRPLSYYREIVFGQRINPYITIINPDQDISKLIKTPWVLSDAKAIYYGQDNQQITAQVFSSGDTVKLYLNDKFVGEEPVINNIAIFNFKYQAGTLKAITFANDTEIGNDILSTVSSDNQLQVEIINGNTNQLKFIQIHDSQIIAGRGTELGLSDINGELLAFGNGDPKNICSYGSVESYTFDGHAMAVVSADTKTVTINGTKYSI